MTKKDNISYSETIEKIENNLKKSKFYYKMDYKYDELINNFKKNRFNSKRVISCLKIFIQLVIAYFALFIIILKKINITIPHIIVILILFLISIILNYFNTKRSILNLVKKSGTESYFYDDYFIIKDKNTIQRYEYKDITLIIENEQNFSLAIKENNLFIKKKEISKDFIDFLTHLKNNYKTIQTNITEYNQLWDSIDEDITNYDIKYLNVKERNLLKDYYSTKESRLNLFKHYLILNFVYVNIVFFIMALSKIARLTIGTYIFCMILVSVITLFCVPRYIDKTIDIILKMFKVETLYFYNNFILVKTDTKIIKYENNDLTFFEENDNYIFIKIKNYKCPIIIEKNKLSDNNLNFLRKYNTIVSQ